ncbi:hypothetical protein [Hwanghaeella grinnelliae]|nr:hypothetical protein [Hwanghaeella grinnelliae]
MQVGTLSGTSVAAVAPEMFEVIFTDRDITNYRDVVAADAKKLAA